MIDLLEIFQLPFMLRALLAGIMLGAVLAYLGVFATLKRMSFFGDGIAHASLFGVALGIVTGLYPFGVALVVGVVLGAVVYFLERKFKLGSDAVVGIIFVSGMALGITLLSLQTGYQPELISFLFGNILALSTVDVLIMTGLSAAILIFLIAVQRQLALTILDHDTAWLAGVPVAILEFVFYVVLALAVVLGVKLLGIILISALLILPATTAKLISHSFNQFVAISIILSELTVVVGLLVSYLLDLPSGATIVLTGTTLFILTTLGRRMFSNTPLTK